MRADVYNITKTLESWKTNKIKHKTKNKKCAKLSQHNKRDRLNPGHTYLTDQKHK